MSPEQAIRTVWRCGNPNIAAQRIEDVCVPKVDATLEKHGFACACHGSYSHLAMEIIADRDELIVEHKKSQDIVTLKTGQ